MDKDIKQLHAKALDAFAKETPNLLKKLAEVMDARTKLVAENERLKADIKKLEEVPLCADHAQAWFTARYFKEGDCWYCQATDARVKELETMFEYALGPGSLKYYRDKMPKPQITVTPIDPPKKNCGCIGSVVCPVCRPDYFKTIGDYQ